MTGAGKYDGQPTTDNGGPHPVQVSLAWMTCKKSFVVPVPGTRKRGGLLENLGAADVALGGAEVAEVDAALSSTGMSAVYGGTAVKK